MLRPLIDRCRKGDIWVVESGGSPSHRRGEALTVRRMNAHFDGGPRVGLCPMRRGSSTARLALLDLDSHKGDTPWEEMVDVARRLVACAGILDVALVPFRSSGGSGLHLFALWDEPQDARSVRALLAGILGGCGLRVGTRGVAAEQVEVFPKQDTVPADGWGNMFVLPGAGKSEPLDPETFEPIAWSDVRFTESHAVPIAEPAPAAPAVYIGAPPELAEVQAALDQIDPNRLGYGGEGREVGWLEILFATHSATGGSAEGLAMFLAWSSRWSRFDPGASAEHTAVNWRAARPEGGIGVGTLYRAANEATGWVPPSRRPTADGFEVLDAGDDAGTVALRSADVLDEFQHVAPGNLALTEDSFALAVERTYGSLLRYVHGAGCWRIWTGRRWVDDRTRAVRDLVRRVVRAGNTDEKASAGKHSFVAGVEAFMLAARTFATEVGEWDTDPMQLGTPSGVLDLRTGQLWAPDPSLLISKSVAVDPADPGVQAPRWMQFLHETTGGDAELVQYLQRVLGYALTGKTIEHLLVFIYGEGGNGKGVFLDAVRGVFGDYGQAADVSLFTRQKHEGHPTDRAALMGARLVTAGETERGHQWAEARLKALTGGDPIRARFIRQDEIQFDPQFQLLIVGNHKPALSTIDDAMRRRLALVEFNQKPARVNPALGEELRAEYPAILRWMVDGCLSWQRDGLGARPTSVIDATERYFDEQDVVGSWLADRCDLGATFREAGSALYRDWSDYCRTVGAESGSLASFGTTLDRRGFAVRKTRGNKVRHGLRIKPFDSGASLGAGNLL